MGRYIKQSTTSTTQICLATINTEMKESGSLYTHSEKVGHAFIRPFKTQCGFGDLASIKETGEDYERIQQEREYGP